MQNNIFLDFTGKVLIASPYVKYNDIFSKSVIYIMKHDSSGSTGLIINHLMSYININSLLKQNHTTVSLSTNNDTTLPIYLGGPIELEKGFFIHTNEYNKNLLYFNDNIAVSSNPEIVKDIAFGQGPKYSLFVLGYTGWNPGQLENEIENNMWIAANTPVDLLFADIEREKKWHMILKYSGVNENNFMLTQGHC